MQKKWDDRYREERYSTFLEPRPFLIESAAYLPFSGLAFDAAMGLGGNAGFLLERGLDVIGADLSGIAVRAAKEKYPRLMAVIADLTRFHLPPAKFDVILNFFFLERSLVGRYIRSLKPGGVLIFETLTREMLELRPDIEPEFLLEPGELRSLLAGLEILSYREGKSLGRQGHPRFTAAAAAKKS